MKHFKRLLSLLLCLALLPLSGCGSESLNSFTWFVDSIPANLDPQTASASADVIACTHLYSGLFRLDTDGTPQPELCESYTVSADGKTYTFTLKSGQKYRTQRGKDSDYTITAQDFVFAFRRIFRADTVSPYTSLFSGIVNGTAVREGRLSEDSLGVSAEDDTTLTIRLQEADDDFLAKLAQPGAAPCNEEYFESTLGTYGLTSDSVLTSGPFYLYNWTDSGCFLRSDKKGSSINSLRLVQNTTSTMTAAQLIENDKCSAALDEGGDAVNLQQIPYTDTTWALVFNCDTVFGNPDLRRALTAAAQQCGIPENETLYGTVEGLIPDGASVDGLDYREAAGTALYTPAEDGRTMYMRAVEAVGAEALNGLSILVPESADEEYVEQLNGLWQSEYGLFLNIETVTDEAYASRYASGKYTVTLAPVTLSSSDPVSLPEAFLAGKSGYVSDRCESLLQRAVASTAREKAQLIGDAERQITDDCAASPLFCQYKRLLVSSSVSGLRFEPYGPVIDVTGAKISG